MTETSSVVVNFMPLEVELWSHPDLAIGVVGSTFQLATAVGPAMRTQIEVCFVVLVSFGGWLTYALLLRSPALSLLITRGYTNCGPAILAGAC